MQNSQSFCKILLNMDYLISFIKNLNVLQENFLSEKIFVEKLFYLSRLGNIAKVGPQMEKLLEKNVLFPNAPFLAKTYQK